jgi:hypothetical protein
VPLTELLLQKFQIVETNKKNMGGDLTSKILTPIVRQTDGRNRKAVEMVK